MQTCALLYDQRQEPTTEIDITDDDLLLLQTEIQIQQMEASLAQLVQHRAYLKARINYRCSPILQFPPEILGAIFPYLCAMQTIGPLFLGKICKAWRDIVWSDSRLWTTLRLSGGQLSPASVPILKEWLSRSGNRPLSIFVNHKYASFSPKVAKDRVSIQEVMDTLVSVSERWQTIDLYLPRLPQANFSVPSNCPLLTSLTLNNNHVKIPQAPRLRDVHLNSVKDVTLPWDQITSLTLAFSTSYDTLDIIQQCSQLEHCTLTSIPTDLYFPVHIGAPSIRSLAWNNIYGHTMLDALTVRNVHDMSFRKCSLYSSLDTFLCRSSCLLQRLSLDDVEISETLLLNCLRIVPSLTELNLSHLKIRKDSVLVPEPLDANSRLLPDLRVLTYSGFILFDHASCAAFVSFRWTSAQHNPAHRVLRLEAVNIKTIIPPFLLTNGIKLSLLLRILD